MEIPEAGYRSSPIRSWPEFRRSLAGQSWKLSAAIVALVAILTLSLLLGALIWELRPGELLRDRNASASVPPHYGLISTLGAALWLAAGASALLAWAATASTRSAVRQVLLVGGALTVLLALDDLLVLHDGILPRLGVPEIAVYAAYCVLAAIFVLLIAPVVFATEWLLLAAGIAALAASVLTDLFITSRMISTWTGQVLLEEVVFKLSGILFWSFYFLRLSLAVLSARGRPLAE